MVYNDLEEYERHPRIMELRIAFLFVRLRREYDYNTVVNIFQGLSHAFTCNWKIIKGIIDNLAEIRKMQTTDWLRYRQELIFLGYLDNKTKRQIALDIGLAETSLYTKKYDYDIESFLDKEWLKGLDDSVTLAGIPQYKIEIFKFLTGLKILRGFL